VSMKKILIYIIVLGIIVLGLYAYNSSKFFSAFISDVLVVENPDVPSLSSLVAEFKPKTWSMFDKIKDAQEILKISPDLQYEEDENKKLIRKEISLAVLDTKTGEIFEKRYWLEEEEIKEANSIRRAYESNPVDLPRFFNENKYNEFLVIVNWWNNHNSDLNVIKADLSGDEIIINKDPSRYIVVANKFLMGNDKLAYPEDRTGIKYSDIVYTPYSKVLINKESINGGHSFLSSIVDQAFFDLRSTQIKSKAFPGNLVVDTITPIFMKNLILTEQTDPMLILLSDDGGLELAQRVLVRLDTNRERTFRFTVSKTGASGPAQIMPRTYDSIVRGYPEAELIADTDIGRVDMVNAIKASLLVLDDHMATVVTRVNRSSAARSIFNAKTDDQLDDIRAAIYNGGSSKYIPSTGRISTRVNETVQFVKKFTLIRALNMFE
jgi:hypothetical protein